MVNILPLCTLYPPYLGVPTPAKQHISECTSLAQLGEDALKGIRTTNEEIPRYSVYDVIGCVTGHGLSNRQTAWVRLMEQHAEVGEFITHFKFPGQGQRYTPVCIEGDAVRIMHLLPGVQNDAACDRAGVKRKRGVNKRPDDLYIMRYSFRSDIIKIGRSSNPEKRRRELEACQAFSVEILAIFPGCERLVHGELNDVRNCEGAGREWFKITPASAFKVVDDLCGGAV